MANFLDGLREFNRLRNKFAHKLDYSIKAKDLDSIKKFVQLFLNDKNVEELELIDIIEEFTKWTFGFLRIQPDNIQNIFNDMIEYGLGKKGNA